MKPNMTAGSIAIALDMRFVNSEHANHALTYPTTTTGAAPDPSLGQGRQSGAAFLLTNAAGVITIEQGRDTSMTTGGKPCN